MTHSGSHVFATHNDLPVHLRETMTTLLNQQLADTFDLYSQVKQAHWNVKGMHFIQLHKLFDELAESLIDPLMKQYATLEVRTKKRDASLTRLLERLRLLAVCDDGDKFVRARLPPTGL